MHYLDHEDLLKRATPSELKKLFLLAADFKLLGLPVNQHSEPFIQSVQELTPLPYNPL